MDKSQIEKGWAFYYPSGAIDSVLVRQAEPHNVLVLPISDDGKVGGLEEWMVHYCNMGIAPLGLCHDDAEDQIATAISAIIQAAKGGE